MPILKHTGIAFSVVLDLTEAAFRKKFIKNYTVKCNTVTVYIHSASQTILNNRALIYTVQKTKMTVKT